MANTYTQAHFQLVFAPKFRAACIHKSWKDSLYKYLTTVLQDRKHKMLQINGIEDHIHILFGYRLHETIPSLVNVLKSESTKWINHHRFLR